MLNPNDAAYILQPIYPLYVAYSQLPLEDQIENGGFCGYLDRNLRAGIGQRFMTAGTVGYVLIGIFEKTRKLWGNVAGNEDKRRALIKEAIDSFSQTSLWLRQKGRTQELQALQSVVAGKQDSSEFLRLWPRCVTQLKIYAQDLSTLDKSLRAKLHRIEQLYGTPEVLVRSEDLKDLRSFFGLITTYLERRHQGANLYRAYRRTERLMMELELAGKAAVTASAGDLLESLSQVLCCLLRNSLDIPPKDAPQSCLWGLSESSFLALCVSASAVSSLKTIRIQGRHLRHRLPTTALSALASVISNNPELTLLDLRDHQLPGPAWRPLAQALKHCPKLSQLHLSGNPLGESGCDALVASLERLNELAQLSLRHSAIDEGALQVLGDALCGLAYLKRIDLSHNPLQSQTGVILGRLLRQGQLRRLDLSHCSLSDSGAEALAAALKRAKKLRVLDLSYCDLSNRGASQIEDSLKQHRPAPKLFLEGNHLEIDPQETLLEIHQRQHDLLKLIGPSAQGKEVKRLVHALLSFAKADAELAPRLRLQLLETLDQRLVETRLRAKASKKGAPLEQKELLRELFESYVEFHPDQRVRRLARSYKEMEAGEVTTLLRKILGTKGVQLGDEGCLLIESLLRENKLRTLDLKGQEIAARGADALGEGLANTTVLTKLSVSDTYLEEHGIINLGLGLLTNHSLRSFELLEVGLNEEACASLGDSVAGNSGLRELTLSQQGLDPKASYALLHELRRDRFLSGLHLRGLQLDDDAVEELAFLIESHPKLTTLELSGTALSHDYLRRIAQALKKNKQLKELRLPHCQIDDEGSIILDDVLSEHRSIQKLDLLGNHLTEQGKDILFFRSEMDYAKRL
jgi:Ran GTPase-activating protein (RanGAP) involved in mRNA processing and transport